MIVIIKALLGKQCIFYDTAHSRFCRALIERKRQDSRKYPLSYVGRTSLKGEGAMATSILPDSKGGDYGVYIIYNSPDGSDLKEGVFGLSDQRLLFMNQVEHGARKHSSEWRWNEVRAERAAVRFHRSF